MLGEFAPSGELSEVRMTAIRPPTDVEMREWCDKMIERVNNAKMSKELDELRREANAYFKQTWEQIKKSD